VLDASGADNWEERPYIPYYRTADWFENGERAHLPENFYSSEFIVDQMIDYMNTDAQRDEPFFAYLAFQAVHIPVQAPREYSARYRGQYDGGWEQLRARRWQRAQELALPANARSTPRPPRVGALSGDEQALYARSMEVPPCPRRWITISGASSNICKAAGWRRTRSSSTSDNGGPSLRSRT
jgi:arylsulfatase/uncharacterized sulfatase